MNLRASLRLKITLWFVGVFALIQILLVLAIVALRQDSIRRASDSELEAQASAMVDNILVAEPDWTPEAIEELVPHGAGFTLFCIRDEEGRPVVYSGLGAAEELPFSEWESVPTGPVGPVLTTLSRERSELLVGEPEAQRLVSVPFRLPGDRLHYLQATTPAELLGRSFGPFRDLFLIGVPVGITAALVSAWLIAGRAVRPMVRLSEAAQGVSPETLGTDIHVESSDAEVEALQAEWNQALGRLKEGFAAQDRFLGTVSHELKTPVSVLLAEAQALERGRHTKQEFQDYVQSAREELLRIGNLVESFLSLARVEHKRDPIDREVCSLNDLVVDAVRNCTPLAKMHGVSLVPTLADPDSAGGDPHVRGHPDLLRSLLENLMRNAVRFSPADAPVAIEVASVAGEAVVEVRDQGPGIPAARQEDVFRRFVSSSNESPKPQGTGLGLSIAKDVVELHGGSISVRNHEPRGCSFLVRLPLEADGEITTPA